MLQINSGTLQKLLWVFCTSTRQNSLTWQTVVNNYRTLTSVQTNPPFSVSVAITKLYDSYWSSTAAVALAVKWNTVCRRNVKKSTSAQPTSPNVLSSETLCTWPPNWTCRESNSSALNLICDTIGFFLYIYKKKKITEKKNIYNCMNCGNLYIFHKSQRVSFLHLFFIIYCYIVNCTY